MPGISKLAGFAILLLLIVVNQAGCEQVFSQIDRQNRLNLPKLGKMMKVNLILVHCDSGGLQYS